MNKIDSKTREKLLDAVSTMVNYGLIESLQADKYYKAIYKAANTKTKPKSLTVKQKSNAFLKGLSLKSTKEE